MVALWKHGKPD